MKRAHMRVGFLLGTCLIALGFLLLSPIFAGATIVTFEYNIEYSGGVEPQGTPPWLTATFDDMDSPGTVQLTLSGSGLIDSEFIKGKGNGNSKKGWFFNLNPAKSLSDLTIVYASGKQATDVIKDMNALRAGPDGFFDILFHWKENPFVAGDTAVYNLGNIGDLVATDFEFLSVAGPGGTPGPFLSAAHVQGINDPSILDDPDNTDGSGWVAPGAPVPEPATMLLFGTGLVGLAGLGRKKFFNKR